MIFPVRPYHRNITRSLLKEPKYYFYDTGAIEGDISAKVENVVALALLRELHFVEDTTGSKVALHYLNYLPDVKPVQLVYKLKRKKSTPRMKMLPVHEFLATIELKANKNKGDPLEDVRRRNYHP